MHLYGINIHLLYERAAIRNLPDEISNCHIQPLKTANFNGARAPVRVRRPAVRDIEKIADANLATAVTFGIADERAN